MATEKAFKDWENAKIVEKNGKFYIGDDIGPFNSREEAEEVHKVALELITF